MAANCPRVRTVVPFNYVVSGMARSFLERQGKHDADRTPAPTLAPATLLVHSYPLVPPLPLPFTQLDRHAVATEPDRGLAGPYPHLNGGT